MNTWGSASLTLGSTPPMDINPALLLQCEGEDLNLHGRYPTSTSRALGAGTELEALLATDARTLLMAAASGIPTEPERMRAFARACLEVNEMGRLALAVLDGGVFAPRRALELAKTVADAVGATPAAKRSQV